MMGLIILGLLLSLFGTFVVLRNRFPTPPNAHLGQLLQIVEQLGRQGGRGAFAVFLFPPEGEPQGDPVNLQFSIEGERLGLDWVLRAPRNIADTDKVRGFVTERGFAVSEHEMNGTHYLRVEGDGIALLGRDVATKLYGLPLAAQVGLIVEGFSWPPLR